MLRAANATLDFGSLFFVWQGVFEVLIYRGFGGLFLFLFLSLIYLFTGGFKHIGHSSRYFVIIPLGGEGRVEGDFILIRLRLSYFRGPGIDVETRLPRGKWRLPIGTVWRAGL